ncbi:MAG: hypothetical protein ABIZ72_11875, partial [Candidatus Limnocylindrales bacterium]
MRRSLAALAATVLLLSTVGSAVGADPDSSATPAPTPIVEPTPQPTPSVGPAGAPVAPAPSADAAVIPSSSPFNAIPADPTEPAAAPIVQVGPAADHTPDAGPAADTVDPTNRWIVVLKPGTDAAAAADRQGRRIGFSVDRTFKSA